MQAFAYQAATSLADAVKAVAAGAKPIAGGQTLLQTMKMGLATPESLVDLSGIDELKRIEVSGTTVKIGAMATHASVAASEEAYLAMFAATPASRSRPAS